MPKAAFSAEFVRDLKLRDSGQTTIFDTNVDGLGIRVGSKSKKYIVVGYVAGQRIWVTQGKAPMTYTEAKRWARGVLGDMARGTNPNAAKAEQRASTLTLADALELHLSQNLKPTTAKENRRLIERDLSDWLKKDLKTLTPTMVVRRFDKLTERSPAIANHVFWVLRAVISHARVVTKTDLGEFTLPPNPCDRLTDLKRWHKPQSRTGTLSEAQYPAFMEALAEMDQTFADYMETLLRTGLRRTEAASLRWTDIDFAARTFTVRAEVAKNGKAVTLPVPTQLLAILERRRDAEPDTAHVFGDAKRYDPRKSLTKLRKALGSDLTYHDCRRTFLQLAEKQEVPSGFIKKLVNHTDSRDVTATHYTNKSDAEALRPYAQRINDQIDRLANIYNPDLKARDALASLKQAVDDLSEFDQYSGIATDLRRIVSELAQ